MVNRVFTDYCTKLLKICLAPIVAKSPQQKNDSFCLVFECDFRSTTKTV